MGRMKTVSGLICAAAMASSAQGQSPPAGPRPALGPGRAEPTLPAKASPAEVVAEARKLLRARYVLPATASKLDAALLAAERAGEFRGLEGEALADKLNTVLRRVTADGHLSVSYDPRMAAMALAAPSPGAGGAPPPEMIAEIAARVTSENAGIHKLERLPGNIRYIDYASFGWGADPSVPPAIEHAMRFLLDGDAIVIDLRGNNGGSPAAVAQLASYFLPPATKLVRFEMRNAPGDSTETSAVPFSLAGKPAYFLIGPGSASAAEEFALHVSAFKIGTLVGQTTAGGAFRNEFEVLPGGYILSISVGRPVHAVTGGDWEGTGVAPAIKVPVAQALAAAQVDALQKLLPGMDPRERMEAERLIAFHRASLAPVAAALELAAYTGVYGPRTIRLEGGVLTTNRPDRPSSALRAIAPNMFAPVTAPFQQFRFVTEGGKVVAVEVDSGNGPERFSRTPLP